MSFELPRKPPRLHFTGSVRAARDEAPPPRAAGRPLRAGAPPGVASVPPPRPRAPSFDDDLPTLAFDRDALPFAPVASVRRQHPDRAAAHKPIPNFRPAPAAPLLAGGGTRFTPTARTRTSAMPLVVWVALAVAVGAISYRVTPDAVEQVAAMLDGR
jgi:hypothetical protein